MRNPEFDTLEHIIAAAAEQVRPPERVTVTEAAEMWRHMDNPGNYVGPYTRTLAPAMVEPNDILTSDEFTAMVLAGPAQCAKTEGVMSWVTYSAIHDPADMMIIPPTNAAARDFSKRRLNRLYRDTPELKKRLLSGTHGTNVFDTQFRSGMLLTLGHPSSSELAGKPIPRLWLTDYDRMPQDIDGEGSPFDLARKRTQTFRRFGMTVAESSPSFEVSDPKWMGTTKHEAPPTTGILALYNRGDRRRYYWRCPHCDTAFEPEFKYLIWPDEGDDVFKGENAVMACPHCAGEIPHSMKSKLNLEGKWIKDGMTWEEDGSVSGVPFRSDIASFWLKGVAASFADWKTLVINFIKASEEYEKTGSEEALKTTTNVDQGDPYVSKSAQATRLPEELKNRAEDWGGSDKEPVVPEGVRFLVATIDVQGGHKACFVVHVYGVGVAGDIWHVDMRKIRKSKRLDDDGDPLPIDPAAYPEDWHVLVEQVIEHTYPLGDGSPRRMQIKLTGCDSGGADGVTTNAYKFFRYLKKETQHALRFQLLKGEANPKAQRYKISHPDSQRRDRHAGARGDIPVGFINSNLQKDTVSTMLGRTEPGGGMIHFPHWAPDWLYTQLTAEVRTPKGWVAVARKRNEAFDLLYYCVSLLLDVRIKIEQINWDKAPGWAQVWDKNDMVIEGESAGFVVKAKKAKKSLRNLGDRLA